MILKWKGLRKGGVFMNIVWLKIYLHNFKIFTFTCIFTFMVEPLYSQDNPSEPDFDNAPEPKWSKDDKVSYIQGLTQTPNQLLCLIDKVFQANHFINYGPYKVSDKRDLCFGEGISRPEILVEVTQGDQEGAPMITRSSVDMESWGLYFLFSIQGSVTNENPFGVFSMSLTVEACKTTDENGVPLHHLSDACDDKESNSFLVKAEMKESKPTLLIQSDNQYAKGDMLIEKDLAKNITTGWFTEFEDGVLKKNLLYIDQKNNTICYKAIESKRIDPNDDSGAFTNELLSDTAKCFSTEESNELKEMQIYGLYNIADGSFHSAVEDSIEPYYRIVEFTYKNADNQTLTFRYTRSQKGVRLKGQNLSNFTLKDGAILTDNDTNTRYKVKGRKGITRSQQVTRDDPFEPNSTINPSANVINIINIGPSGDDFIYNKPNPKPEEDQLQFEGKAAVAEGEIMHCPADNETCEVSQEKTCEAPPGYYCSPGSTEPLRCPAGSYCPGGRLSEATPCPAGTFNPYDEGVSVDSCEKCDAGQTTDQEGQTSKDSCKTATFQIKISGD